MSDFFEYIRRQADAVDVFCFQEVLKGGVGCTGRGEVKDLYEKLQSILPEHEGVFFAYADGGYYSESSSTLDFVYGVACFVRKGIPFSELGGTHLFPPEPHWEDGYGQVAAGAMQVLQVDGLVVAHIHGLWQEGTQKRDCEARFGQLAIIQHYLAQYNGKVVLCGDFNVAPDTRFLYALTEQYRDLVREYAVTSTRSNLYDKEQRFADYVLLDPSLPVHAFRPEEVTVSDHLPLVVEL